MNVRVAFTQINLGRITIGSDVTSTNITNQLITLPTTDNIYVWYRYSQSGQVVTNYAESKTSDYWIGYVLDMNIINYVYHELGHPVCCFEPHCYYTISGNAISGNAIQTYPCSIDVDIQQIGQTYILTVS